MYNLQSMMGIGVYIIHHADGDEDQRLQCVICGGWFAVDLMLHNWTHRDSELSISSGNHLNKTSAEYDKGFERKRATGGCDAKTDVDTQRIR